MKTVMTYVLAVFVSVGALTAGAQTLSVDQSEHGIGLLLGYRNISIEEMTYNHGTHPDDGFLGGSDAGTTSIGGRSHYALIGLRYQPKPFAEKWTVNFDAGALAGGKGDNHQNDNDTRPASQGSFVYTQAHFGMMAGVGLSYNLGRWSLGGQAELLGVYASSGWNRFGQHEKNEGKFLWQIGVGPKVGYRLGESTRLELGALFGNGAPVFALTLSYFLN